MSPDLEKLKIESPVVFMLCLSHIYQDLVFFPDEDITVRFIELGVKHFHLKWFTSLEEIKIEFERIEYEGLIRISKQVALQMIKLHLDVQVYAEMQLWGNFFKKKNGITMNMVTESISNIIRRRDYAGGNISSNKDSYSKNIDDLVEHLQKKDSDQSGLLGMFLQNIKGETEDNFQQFLLDDCIYPTKKIPDTKYFSSVFPLIKLINKKKYMMSKIEFEKSEKYLMSYERYQAIRVKKIIYKNNKPAPRKILVQDFFQ